MAVEKTKDLWVFIETEDEGTAKSVGLELLVPGRRLADKQNGKLVAVILGSNVAPALEAVKAHGADEAIVVDQPELNRCLCKSSLRTDRKIRTIRNADRCYK